MNFKGNLLKKSIILLVLILVAGTAFGANGDTINIGGVVPLVLNLTVTADGDADNLDLTAPDTTVGVEDTVAVPSALIADIDISTNNTAGWELWIYSENIADVGGANNGTSVMMNADNDEITYELTYTGTDDGAAVATGYPDNNGVQFGEATADESATLTIAYTQSDSYPAGYYSDQLTLVLRAK